MQLVTKCHHLILIGLLINYLSKHSIYWILQSLLLSFYIASDVTIIYAFILIFISKNNHVLLQNFNYSIIKKSKHVFFQIQLFTLKYAQVK